METVMGAGASDDVRTLCERLRSERLLVASEHTTLRQLNETVSDDLGKLSEKIWICRQEQLVLKKLINSDPSVQPDNCCRILAALNTARFVSAHRAVGHHVSTIFEIIRLLLKSPKATAQFLNAVDHIGGKDSFTYSLDDLYRACFNFLYGSCVFPLDERKMLEVLAQLISLQSVTKVDPRRFLRKGSNAFSKLYSMFSEELFSAKIFLTAALHEPIMYLLSQDEAYLDIDANKSPIRLLPEERRRRFGTDEGSHQYKERMAAYRRSIVDRLVSIAQKFVNSIHLAMPCFPSTLTWLVCQLKRALLDKKMVSNEEADLICTDLVFTNFLCQAIIHPEPHGIISDTPITHVARFNLIQVGQILQYLALMPYEEPPASMEEVLSRITENLMPQVVHSILDSNVFSLNAMFPGIVLGDHNHELYARSACYGTLAEIQTLLEYLRTNAVDSIVDEPTRRSLNSLVRRLPDDFQSINCNGFTDETSESPKSGIPRSSSGRLRNIVDRVHNVAKSGQHRLLTNLRSSPNFDVLDHRLEGSPPENQTPSPLQQEAPQVLVFSLDDEHVPLGLESEEKIMSAVKPAHPRKHTTSDSLAEKKTRFKATESVVSDQTGTTDAASDDEEEEAAGSITSSDPAINDVNLDEDDVDDPEDVSTLPDNFSDVVPISANVSGRGSPSLSGGRGSGRGTPFSGGGGLADPAVSVSSTMADTAGNSRTEAHRNLPKLPVTIRKQNPEGLEEKFGKFGLPPQDPSRYRDETNSLVSDSWSTDVVASDNEGLNEQSLPSQSQQSTTNMQQPPPPIPPRLEQPQPLPVFVPQLVASAIPCTPPVLHESLSAGRISDLATTSSFSGSNLSVAERERIADDILSKYRGFAPAPSASTTLSNGARTDPIPSSSKSEEVLYYDPNNITQCKAFIDAKRKLRLVLSSAANIPINTAPTASVVSRNHDSSNLLINDIATSSRGDMRRLSANRAEDDPRTNLNDFLKLLLAESINSQDKTLSAQVREVQRCLAVFDQRGIRKLLRSLRGEHRRRTSYLMYLQQSRLTLLQLNSYLTKLSNRVTREKSLTGECLIEMLVRFYMERKEKFVRKFLVDFRRSRAQDERTYLVDRTLSDLYAQVSVEPMWQCLSEYNVEFVRKSMDRLLMAQIYHYALYPNADADIYRDEFFFRVFYKSLRSIASYVTPDHPEIHVPKRFHGECPWPSAQAEISIINAYKSPRDKMACVMRCCETIEHLLSLALERATASADDITPVLVYVLLQANPPALLSNIQYMDAFYANRMPGEEAYWWTQFRASVEYLKQLCNKHLSPTV